MNAKGRSRLLFGNAVEHAQLRKPLRHMPANAFRIGAAVAQRGVAERVGERYNPELSPIVV